MTVVFFFAVVLDAVFAAALDVDLDAAFAAFFLAAGFFAAAFLTAVFSACSSVPSAVSSVSAVSAADSLRARVRRELGLTLSVGISFNKVFAKLGSDYRKPDATTVISRENWQQLVWPLPVGDLLYVGGAAKKLLKPYGVETIGRMHLEDAIGVLRQGDGNENPAQAFQVGTKPISGTAGTLSYEALLDFWSQFDPYTMNTMLVSGDMMLAMLKLSEFQNPLTGLNFQGTGTLSTPLGAQLLRTSALPAGTMIGLDRGYALEQICGSEITVEYDKLIDRQLERAAITSISGFAKLFADASKVLTVQ